MGSDLGYPCFQVYNALRRCCPLDRGRVYTLSLNSMLKAVVYLCFGTQNYRNYRIRICLHDVKFFLFIIGPIWEGSDGCRFLVDVVIADSHKAKVQRLEIINIYFDYIIQLTCLSKSRCSDRDSKKNFLNCIELLLRAEFSSWGRMPPDVPKTGTIPPPPPTQNFCMKP